jgi:hypothetical protein
MPEVSINYLAVLVAGVSAMVIGGIWYAKPVFGRKWQQMLKLDEAKMKQGAPMALGGMFVLALVTAYVLAHIVDYAQSTDWMGGLQAGAWVWLGFVVSSVAGNNLFERRPWGPVWIFLGNQLVTLLTMGVILAVWQ